MRVIIQPVKASMVLRLTADALILAGGCALAVWAWGLIEGAWYQYTQGVQFARTVAGEDSEIATENADSGSRPQSDLGRSVSRIKARRPLATLMRRDPQLLGKMDAPGFSVMIREGIDDDTLRKAVGHLPSSAAPGGPGNFVLLGHRDTFFRGLRDIHRGDAIHVRTRTGNYTYLVESLEVTDPESVRIENGTGQTATLITCFPFTYIGPAPRRFVVHARLTGSH